MIIFVVSVILYNFAVDLDGFTTAHRVVPVGHLLHGRRHTLQAHSRILTDLTLGNKNIAVQTICPKTLIASKLHFQNPIIQ